MTAGKPYWRHPGAKFGHFVGDVEAKSGYGDFKWVLAIMLDPFEGQVQLSYGHVGAILRPTSAILWLC